MEKYFLSPPQLPWRFSMSLNSPYVSEELYLQKKYSGWKYAEKAFVYQIESVRDIVMERMSV